MIKNSSLYLLIFSLFFISCSKPTEIDYTKGIDFKILDASCTEVWIEIRRVDLSLSGDIEVKRGDSTVFNFKLEKGDTIVVDEGLEPGRVYRYSLFYSGRFISSQDVRTLDTTSHEFEWKIFEFGDMCGSSLFYDVEVVNDTLIYAVGEIKIKDSTGNCDPEPYNLARWDGKKWDLLKIKFLTFCNQNYLGSYPANAIFSFGPDKVFIASGREVVIWDGVKQSAPVCIPVDVREIWGDSPTSVWAVGYDSIQSGAIAHFDGMRWQRIESGTDWPIQDIWGDVNSKTGEIEILCVASDIERWRGMEIIKILGDNTVKFVSKDGLPVSLRSIWFKRRNYYVAGDGLYFTRDLNLGWRRIGGILRLYKEKIRGQDVNDVFLVGDFGLVAHFNGLSWRNYTGVELPYGDSIYVGVDIKGDIVSIVGVKASGRYLRGIALIGKRKK